MRALITDWQVELEGYQSVVATPMDLGTVKLKLDRGRYRSLEAFEADLRCVWTNCFAFNQDSSAAHRVRMSA